MKILKKSLIYIITIILCFTLTGIIYANEIIPNSNARLSNGWYWENTPTNIFFNCDFDTNEREAVRDAMQAWNSIKTPNNESMVSMYLTTGSTNNKVSKVNTIFNWVGYCEITPTVPGKITSVHIKLNNYLDWSVGASSGKYDIQTVVQHELGHALGVAHCHEATESSPCWSATCLDNIMNPFVSTNKVNVDFQPYDEASYIVIYW